MIDRERAHLFLAGFMGCGKSTVAGIIADRIGRPSVDLDARIEAACGRTIAQVFSGEGEALFRKLESDELERLTSGEPSVVALGGGTPEVWANRRRLRNSGRTVWLDLNLEETRRRVGSGHDRPKWDDAKKIDFRAFFERRRVVYALSDGRVDVSGMDPARVADAVVTLFEGFFD